MGSYEHCRIEGFICRLCSQLDRNVIHIYTEEGLQKKLEQKINVYLKINLTRFDPLPKVICLPCDAKLEQHHRFIQRVIQNQKKIQDERRQAERPLQGQSGYRIRIAPYVPPENNGSNNYNIVPPQRQVVTGGYRVRIAPYVPPESNGSNSFNTVPQRQSVTGGYRVRIAYDLPPNVNGPSNYNLETVSSSSDDSAEGGVQNVPQHVPQPAPADLDDDSQSSTTTEDSSSSSSSSSSSDDSSDGSMNNDSPLVGFADTLEPVNAVDRSHNNNPTDWTERNNRGGGGGGSDSDSNARPMMQTYPDRVIFPYPDPN